ncbi:MAG: PilZ domain-containing protein [Cypionkella sp.]
MQCVAPALACIEDRVGRREATRHRVNLSARITVPDASLRVQLEDISATGAAIRLMHPRAFAGGRLRWLEFSAYCHVAWRNELRCGVVFADPLESDQLRRTLEFNKLIGSSSADKYGRLASAWVHGPGDW